MQHPIDRRMLAQEREHGRGVLHVTLHPHRQRLDTLQQWNALVGDRQAPKSRKPSARARMMKADGPNCSAKTMP